MKDCSITLKDGTEHAFEYKDIGTAIKWAFEQGLSSIKTPYGVLSLIDSDTYDSVMYFAGDGT